ncbi:MAG: DUF4825 domain-containing protein [Anaerovoracaceae bacterium]
MKFNKNKAKGKKMNLTVIIIIIAVIAIVAGIIITVTTSKGENIPQSEETVLEETITQGTTAQETILEVKTTLETKAKAGEKAKMLYSKKVKSITDAPGVNELINSLGLKKNVANYTLELQLKNSPNIIILNFDKEVDKDDRNAFDKDVQKYAEQILALVPNAEQVEWNYKIKKGDEIKNITVFLDTEAAAQLLKRDVKEFGASDKAIQALLDQQEK